jgi:ribosome-associated translation inhibitor RaiA
MRLQVTSHRIDPTADLKDFVERRIHFALGRFAGRIKALSAPLADVNGPREGMDKCCAIRVNAGYGGPLFVRERQDNIYAVVARAVERAERAVQRQLSLERAAGKGPANSRVGFQFGD